MTAPSTVTLSISLVTPMSAADAKILQGMVAAVSADVMPAPSSAPVPDAAGAAVATAPISAAVATAAGTPVVVLTPAPPPLSAADALTAKYFPADPGLAANPSPENSSTIRLGTLISGRPYLRDNAGSVHQMIQPTTDAPSGYTINGAWAKGGGSDGSPIQQLTVRQGEVYVKVSGGQWQHFSSSGGSLYSAALPDAFATDDTGATTSTVAVSSVTTPAAAAPSAIAPGSSGKVLEVGVGQAFGTITDAFKAAAAGDTIHVGAGIYRETPPVITVPLYVKADKGAVLDTTGLATLARQKGAIVPAADFFIDGLEIIGAGMLETEAGGTAAIRPDLGCNYLTVRDCHLHDNQNGVACGDVAVNITIDGGLFENNGLPPGTAGHGYTHNVYASHGTRSVTVQNGWVSTKPNGGHALKSRAFETLVDGATMDAFEAAVIDVPNGSTKCVISNSTLTKPAGSYNHSVVDYATDDASAGNSAMSIVTSTINALCDNPFMLIGGGSVVTVDAATKAKTTGTITANGGKLAGL